MPVRVIIPTDNRREYVQGTIDSVQVQAHTDYAIIAMATALPTVPARHIPSAMGTASATSGRRT